MVTRPLLEPPQPLTVHHSPEATGKRPEVSLPPLQLYISVPLRRAVSALREHLLEYAQLGRSELQIVLRNAQPNGALQFLVGRGAAGGAAEPE